MRPLRSSSLACFLGAAQVLAAPATAAAQPKKPGPIAAAAPAPAGPKPLAESLTGMAKAEYGAGRILYEDGDFANAVVKFQHAYELSTDPRLLWNVAACEKNLRHYTRVLAAIEAYLKDGGALLTDADRKDADEVVKTVRTLVSSLKLTGAAPGATVFVDDENVGVTPLAAPLLVSVGSRTIRLTKPGFKDFVTTSSIAGGTEVTLAVTLEKEVHEGRLVVEAGARDAISVDGKLVATGRWEGVLPSGGHILKVTAPGKVSYQSEVVIQDAARRRVPITLEAAKGGFPTAVVLGSAGALVAAGAVITAVVLTRPSQPAATPGSIAPGVLPVGFGGFRFGGAR